MLGLSVKHLGTPDETRPFKDHKGQMELYRLEGATFGRIRAEPGWRWSLHVGPLTGMKSCTTAHLGYCVAGRIKVEMDDGEQAVIGPGDTFTIPRGHDAYVLGDETFIAYDFGEVGSYAARAPTSEATAPPSIH